jgi:hypothetical protein
MRPKRCLSSTRCSGPGYAMASHPPGRSTRAVSAKFFGANALTTRSAAASRIGHSRHRSTVANARLGQASGGRRSVPPPMRCRDRGQPRVSSIRLCSYRGGGPYHSPHRARTNGGSLVLCRASCAVQSSRRGRHSDRRRETPPDAAVGSCYRRRQPSPCAKQVDVARPCDVGDMPVRADKRALRCNEVEAADWAT